MTTFMQTSKLKALEQFAASFHADFRFTSVNIMVLITLSLAGLILHLCVFPFKLSVVVTIVSVALGLSLVIRITQIWEAVLIFTVMAAVVTYLRHRPESGMKVSRMADPVHKRMVLIETASIFALSHFIIMLLPAHAMAVSNATTTPNIPFFSPAKSTFI